jgi:S-methylmethionine-dependent homocysteine/selenocysteine methylase
MKASDMKASDMNASDRAVARAARSFIGHPRTDAAGSVGRLAADYHNPGLPRRYERSAFGLPKA